MPVVTPTRKPQHPKQPISSRTTTPNSSCVPPPCSPPPKISLLIIYFHSLRNSSSTSPQSSRGSSGPSNQFSPQPPLLRCLLSDGAKVPSRVLSCLSSTSSRFQSGMVVTRLTWSKLLGNSFSHSSYPIIGDICLAGIMNGRVLL